MHDFATDNLPTWLYKFVVCYLWVCSVSLAKHGSIKGGPTLETCQSELSPRARRNALDSTGYASVVSPCAAVTVTDSAEDKF